MAVDHYLIMRAQQRCTGANVHDVNQLLAVYRGYAELSTSNPKHTARVETLEKQVRAFCASGKCDPSWRSL